MTIYGAIYKYTDTCAVQLARPCHPAPVHLLASDVHHLFTVPIQQRYHTLTPHSPLPTAPTVHSMDTNPIPRLQRFRTLTRWHAQCITIHRGHDERSQWTPQAFTLFGWQNDFRCNCAVMRLHPSVILLHFDCGLVVPVALRRGSPAGPRSAPPHQRLSRAWHRALYFDNSGRRFGRQNVVASREWTKREPSRVKCARTEHATARRIYLRRCSLGTK